MATPLKEELFYSMFLLKKIALHFPSELDVHLTEIMVMYAVQKSIAESRQCTGISHIQDQLCISKPAISQTLNMLEQKNYINRDIDKNDRRKFIITLTSKGNEVLEEAKRHSDKIFSHIVSRMGEQDVQKFIGFIHLFSDILQELNQHPTTPDKGDEVLA